MEKIVKGATKIKLAAPKSKYIEPILSATQGGESGVAEIFRTLQLRLRDSTWTIVFKSLIVVHLMIREGAPEVTLRYVADSPKRLAISSFTEAQTQGVNIRRYSEYLLERVKGYRDAKIDFVGSGAGKMRRLTVEKGLLRQTEVVQEQIRAILRCDLLGTHDPDNEITLTAFRLLTMDLLELYKAMNEGTINVLEHYFEMSRPDAERALNVYKTFGRLTDQVVQYLSLARQYETSTRLEVPNLKHAPTTLTASLEEYLNDPDFEINRRQYLAQQEAKRTGKPIPTPAPSKPTPTISERPAKADSSFPPSSNRPAPAPAKGPAPDLIDFFESIEQNQQPMAQPAYPPQQQFQQGYGMNPQYSQFQQAPQPTGYNPFLQSHIAQQPQQAPSQQLQQQPQLQADYSGAGFGGYTAPPQQAQQAHPFQFPSPLSTIPQNGVVDFQSAPQAQTSVQQLQPQQTSTNPFRQSMMPTGPSPPPLAPPLAPPQSRQGTNPFSRQPTGASQSGYAQNDSMPFGTQHPLTQQQELQTQSTFFTPATPAQESSSQFSPATQLQPQRTGTNPFAKNRSPPPAAPLVANVTGSTNPFRQSAFVNQQTGQGWQHGNQGTFSGFDMNNVETTPIFPRPGAS